MRAHLFALLALLCAVTVFAFDKHDYEIFDLVSALQESEGKGTSFYSFLGVDPSATSSEIARAYRKLAPELHPDKNPGIANAQERFARLGVISKILRDSEQRKKYNFYYKNGVPVWKGLGYAYSRWRPSLVHVFAFLALLTAGLHYIVLRLNYTRDARRVEYFCSAARRLARGASGRRKVKVPMVEGSAGGESLELVVDGENVYLPHDDGSLTSLDELAPSPSWSRTWPAVLVRSLLRRVTGTKEVEEEVEYEADEVDGYEVASEDDSSAVGTPTPSARPRGGRAAQLRAERAKGNGKKARESDSDAAAGTESVDTEEDSEAGARRTKKAGAGKAAGARRRKMAMKK